MGRSLPKHRLREDVCLACDIKCAHYSKSGANDSYMPLKSHKTPRSTDPDDLYAYCKFYDYISFVNKEGLDY